MENQKEDDGGIEMHHRKRPYRGSKQIAILALFWSIVRLLKVHEVAMSLFLASMGQVLAMSGLTIIFLSQPETFVGSPPHWVATFGVAFGGSSFMLLSVNAFEALQKYRTSP